MNDTTVWCQNGSVTESQRELDDPKTNNFLLAIDMLALFDRRGELCSPALKQARLLSHFFF